jgi:hypothetical protein
MKCLAVMLFHNDEDLIEDQIYYMLKNNHDILVFDHNSTDNSREIILNNQDSIVDYYFLESDLIFQNNEVFSCISKILIEDYSTQYDWITFIESDEFLEGPDRTKSYYEHLQSIHIKFSWIVFDNFVFWFTDRDNISISSPRERIKHYAYKKEDGGVRVYAWRGSVTNERYFNHNPPKNGTKHNRYPIHFRTCHYELRSMEHARKKLENRVVVINEQIKEILLNQSQGIPPIFPLDIPNMHYRMMYDKINSGELIISPDELHYDDGSELIVDKINSFALIYNTKTMRKYIPSEFRELNDNANDNINNVNNVNNANNANNVNNVKRVKKSKNINFSRMIHNRYPNRVINTKIIGTKGGGVSKGVLKDVSSQTLAQTLATATNTIAGIKRMCSTDPKIIGTTGVTKITKTGKYNRARHIHTQPK